MGSLFYGASRLEIKVDDTTLAMMQRIIVSKMRRNEPFAITWDDDDSIGDGLSSVWVAPTTELHFKFESGTFPAIDPAELDRMSQQSSTPSGLRLGNATLIAEPTGYDS